MFLLLKKSVILWCLFKLHVKMERRVTGFHLKHAFVRLLVSPAQLYASMFLSRPESSLFSTAEFINREPVIYLVKEKRVE